MSEFLKNIVQALNKPPFNKNFNLISFDSLEPIHLSQVLNNVISEIDSRHKINIREESSDQTALRQHEILRIFRYPLALDNKNMSAFVQGLVMSEKQVVLPILDWLLNRMEELKTRAYLSRYMVKVTVPAEFLQDEQMAGLYEQYEESIQHFKETHKELDGLRNSGINTSDVKKDIETMREEKEQLERRVERQRKRIESYPNSASMLDIAKKLRVQRDRETKLARQITDQKTLMMSLDQKIRRVNQQLREMRQASAGATADTLVQHIEEEARVNQFLVTEKLPKEAAALQKTLASMQKIVNEPAMSPNDLEEIRRQIQATNAQINRMAEQRMMQPDLRRTAGAGTGGGIGGGIGPSFGSINSSSKGGGGRAVAAAAAVASGNTPPSVTGQGDDKQMLFRQQASLIAKRKDNAAQALREARDELARVGQDLEDKREQLRRTLEAASGGAGGEGGDGGAQAAATAGMAALLRGDEFKQFVAQLRVKSNAYKPCRQELNELQAENGILARTTHKLEQLLTKQRNKLSGVESSQGAAGYWSTHDNLTKVSEKMSSLNQRKGDQLDDMSNMADRLASTIEQRKAKLAPLLTELKPLRQQLSQLEAMTGDKRRAYDQLTAGLEVDRTNLEQEVKRLREECIVFESRYHYMSAMSGLQQARHTRLQDEIRRYVSSDPNERKKSLRDAYTRRIGEQEQLAKSLREKQKQVREAHAPSLDQRRQWQDLEKLMRGKIRCREASLARQDAGGDYADVKALEKDRMVL